MQRYIKLAIEKPYLIKDIIYKKHLGVIFSCNVRDYDKLDKDYKDDYLGTYKFTQSKDIEQIFNFYNKMGRSSITKDKIDNWIKKGNHCWLVVFDGEVVGGLWIFFKDITINTLSARVMSKNKTIRLDPNVGYKGYVIIDSNYRGKGIYNLFFNTIMEYYSRDDRIEKIVLTTGASNAPMIKTMMKFNGKLVGIVEVKNILGSVLRQEIFIDYKNRVWG